jgi:ABC-type methionine transport system permease subunit
METSDRLLELVRSLLQQLPSLLAISICVLFAAIRWKRQPRVSLVVIISLLLLILHSLVFGVIYIWVPDAVMRSGWISMPTMLTALGFIHNAAFAVPFALLLIAIFMQRKTVTQNSL